MGAITKKGCDGRRRDLEINSFFWLEQPCIGLSSAKIYELPAGAHWPMVKRFKEWKL